MTNKAFTGDRGARVAVAPNLRLLPLALERIDLSRDASLSQLVTAGLVNATSLIVEKDEMVRRDEDTEGVHQARVGIRRVRSLLRVFNDVLDPAWARTLDGGLSRVAEVLGSVRDIDVLTVRLESSIDALASPDDRIAGVALLRRLSKRRRTAMRGVRVEFDSAGHHEFLRGLVDGVQAPRFAANFVDLGSASVAPGYVRALWIELYGEVSRLSDPPSLGQLHHLRIRAKRVRYACDAVAPVVGRPAARMARSCARLQEVLGDLHDAFVAETWLREAASGASLPRAAVRVAGTLIAHEQAEGERLVETWPELWAKLSVRAEQPWLNVEF